MSIITSRNRHEFGRALKVRYGKGRCTNVQNLESIGVDRARSEAFESPGGVARAGRAGLLLLYLTLRVGILYRMQTRPRGGNFDRAGKCYFLCGFHTFRV